MRQLLPAYRKGKPEAGFTDAQMQSMRELDRLLAAKGFDEYSRAALLGNAYVETGGTFNPDIQNKFGYRGLWQNSKGIQQAIAEQYGNHSRDSQIRYLDDWVSGSTWVKKGKHSAYTSLYSGAFKKAGYKSAQEASEAFQKLYERAAIRDKNGRIIGYQAWDQRNKYANQIYNKLYGPASIPEPQIPIVAQPDVVTVKPVIPEEKTIRTYDNVQASPYVTGKPMVRLQPREIDFGQIAPINLQQFEPEYAPFKYKNGKLPIWF